MQDHGTQSFRLTRDDAYHVQLILTNAGALGQSALSGSVNYCVNGGRDQPYCTGNRISASPKLRKNFFHIFFHFQSDLVVVIFSASATSQTPFITTRNHSAYRVRAAVWQTTASHSSPIQHRPTRLIRWPARWNISNWDRTYLISMLINDLLAFSTPGDKWQSILFFFCSVHGTFCLRVEHANNCPFH